MKDTVRYVFLLGVMALVVSVAHAETYSYDGAGRLTAVVYDDGSSLTYSYDDNGNLVAKTAAAAVDSDNDDIADAFDNCTAAVNPDQRDTDGDGIGNQCDADVATPNNCMVNLQDLAVYRSNFLESGDLDTDNNGDARTDLLDIVILRAQFLKAPGPSANGCN